MPAIANHTQAAFNGAFAVNWFVPGSNAGDPADLSTDAYSNQAGTFFITLVQAASNQALSVSVCNTAPFFPCNVEINTPLLLAEHEHFTDAPIRLKIRNGLSGVAANIVAGAPPGSAFTPRIWIELNDSGTFVPFKGTTGVTGGIWQPGNAPAPFVGAFATSGDRITGVRFGAVRPPAPSFEPLGISCLYCVP